MIILDIEASGLDDASYPIEVAWCDLQGNRSYSRLINPASAGDWVFWDSYAEQAVHGISRDLLAREGENVLIVARELEQALTEEAVYSDAPWQDGIWLHRLFESVGRPNPIRLQAVRDIYCSRYQNDIDSCLRDLVRPHRALADCRAIAAAVHSIITD